MPASSVLFCTYPVPAACHHRDMKPKPTIRLGAFDAQAFLDSAGVAREVVSFQRSEAIFSQGDPADSVALHPGRGRQAARWSPRLAAKPWSPCSGLETSLAKAGWPGQPLRMATATALTPTTTLVIAKDEMVRVLHEERALSDRFIAYMLGRNIRIEEDLIDQLFNSSEKRLARALAPARPIRQAGQAPPPSAQDLTGHARRYGWHDTDSRVNVFHDQVQENGFHRRRTHGSDGQQFPV